MVSIIHWYTGAAAQGKGDVTGSMKRLMSVFILMHEGGG